MRDKILAGPGDLSPFAGAPKLDALSRRIEDEGERARLIVTPERRQERR